MNKNKFYIIELMILLIIIIALVTFSKNKKMEPYIDYWCCTIDNDIKICCDLQKKRKRII